MPSRLIIREIAETFVVVMLVFLALQITVRTYQVEGSSMAPTMDHTDYVLVNKIVYTKFQKNVLSNFLPFVDIASKEVMFPFHTPQRGEIVIFKYPQDETREFVKRVVGISGDLVEIKKGYVYVNGKSVNEQMIKSGHAVSYRKYPHEKTKKYNKIEDKAKRKKRGIWNR